MLLNESIINEIKYIWKLAGVNNLYLSESISTNTKTHKGIELFKKSVENGGKVVFKDNQWIVLVPETFESSKVFGEDTNWFISSNSSDDYEYCLDEYGGKYFINLNLETGDLYLFYFELKQFIDLSSKSVELIKIINNDNKLKQFYANYIQTQENPNYTLIFQLVNNPSEEVQKEAVKHNALIIKYIKNPSEEVQKEAVKRDDRAIQYIKNPSEEVQKIVVEQNGFAIKYIKNPSEEVQKLAVAQNGFAIQYIKNPSEEVQKIAIKQDISSFEYIENPYPSVKKYYEKMLNAK